MLGNLTGNVRRKKCTKKTKQHNSGVDMDKKAKALALGAILSGAFLTGCGVPKAVTDHLATLDEQVAAAQKTADEALRMAKAADHIAFSAQQAANTADELARMAIACCDANSHRLNTMMHDMQKK